jgi:DNA-binding MarR family transcriptional regulator
MATRPPRVTTPVPAPVIPPHLEEAKAATAIRAVTLDPVLHHRTRLAMVAALAATSTLSFTEMRQLLGLTDGNLSVHARKLEAAGYVATTKSRHGRTSRTAFALTPAGRRAFGGYLDQLEAIVEAGRELAPGTPAQL